MIAGLCLSFCCLSCTSVWRPGQKIKAATADRMRQLPEQFVRFTTSFTPAPLPIFSSLLAFFQPPPVSIKSLRNFDGVQIYFSSSFHLFCFSWSSKCWLLDFPKNLTVVAYLTLASQCRARGAFFQHRNTCPTAGISSFLPLRVCYERTPNVL